MSSIPISQLVQVNPGVLAPAGALNSLNGLILTNNDAVPVGATQSFATAADVLAFFGPSAPEYQDALIYFQRPTNALQAPSELLFGQYNSAAAPGWLRGGSLASMTLGQLQALTGTLTVTFGGVANTSASINLSAATSFTAAAATIQAAFTSPAFAVTFDPQRNAFLFTATATGAASTVAYATGTLAAPLLLAGANTGAVLSQGAVAATPAAAMSAFAAADSSWSAFMTTFEPVVADKTSFSEWVSTQGDQYCYVGWDSDVNAKVAGSIETWGYAIQQAKYSGSIPIYGDQTHAAFVLGYAASLDFSQSQGRETLAYKSQSGLIPAVTNATDAQSLIANGYNFYGSYANATVQQVMFQPGSVSGPYLWADSYLNQIWLRANIQTALVNLLTSAGAIPYNQAGYSMIEAAIQDPVNAAINFGAIQPGVTLSASQTQEINQAVGKNVAQTIAVSGYYLNVQPASPATRVQRGSPPITLYYTDGQSVQQIVMSAIDVQ